MPDTTLREKIVVDGADASVAKLNGMAGAAGRVASAFSGLTQAAAVMGGVAGVWKIVETVRDVDRLYATVNRVTNLTEMTAANAHAMLKQFQLGGIELESSERILTAMTRSAEKMSDGFGGVGVQAQMVKQLLTGIGANVKAGPEERLLAMSKAAKAGKLNVDELIRAFMIPRSQASTMMSMLKQGPERLKEIHDRTLHSAGLIDEAALESYRKMLQQRRELREAWQDVVGVLYKNLTPAVTAILQGFKKGFEDIAPIAAVIGKTLSDHMNIVVGATKTYIALLIAAKAINMFSSEKLGILARGRQIFGGVGGYLNRGRAAGAAMDYFEARAASPGIGMFEKAGTGPLGVILGSLRGLPAIFAGIGGAAAGLIPAFVALLPVIGVIAGVLAAIGIVYYALKNNVLGSWDAVRKAFEAVWTTVKLVWDQVVAALKLLWASLQPLIYVVGVVLISQLIMFAKVVELTWRLIAFFIDNNPILKGMRFLAEKFGPDWAKGQAAAAGKEDKKAGPPTIQDFRGSRFEINNNFPQGIDGGRVAVAFSDELAKLGERRLESGLRPLYSIR